MKTIINFIASIILIEVGFFLFFGADMNLNETSKNLTNYQNNNIPTVGTEVDLYVVDISEVFFKQDNITNFKYESECYYVAQINDGRFIVIKTEEGSETDREVSEYSEQYYNYYMFKRGQKPETLYLDGVIDKVPELDNGSFLDELKNAKRDMMPIRGYIRMDVNDIVVDVDHKNGSTMNGVLQQSINIMVSAANALKKFLGVVVIIMGIALIISFIKEILNGVTVETNNKDIIVAGDDVFGNISTIKSDWRKDADKAEMEYQSKNQPKKEKVEEKGFKLKK